MVMDFSSLKAIVRQYFEQFDHGLCLEKTDPVLQMHDLSIYSKLILMPVPPTAENLTLRWTHDLAALIECYAISLIVNETRDSEARYAYGQ
jgi:6-pyruvoyl-tetrahydropterin synthase